MYRTHPPFPISHAPPRPSSHILIVFVVFDPPLHAHPSQSATLAVRVLPRVWIKAQVGVLYVVGGAEWGTRVGCTPYASGRVLDQGTDVGLKSDRPNNIEAERSLGGVRGWDTRGRMSPRCYNLVCVLWGLAPAMSSPYFVGAMWRM